MDEEKCGNCYFYRNKACRSTPPRPFLAGFDPQGQAMITSAFPTPPLHENDWCGHWAPTNYKDKRQ